MSETMPLDLKGITVDDAADIDAVSALYCERRWSDGLPIVPPTLERVTRMLADAEAETEVAVVPPRRGVATLGVLATNAVMAGCLPEHLPVLVSALKAASEKPFNLYSIQATTHPAAPLIVVNGSIRQRLGINCGSGCFGPGHRANATIGRALRLVLMNVGGARPGAGDMSTQGHPGKYTFCIGENEEENPWEPLSVERGLAAGQDAVTLIGGESPHEINDHVSTTARQLLTVCADAMVSIGTNNMFSTKATEMHLVLGPEHAQTIAGDGWSKDDVKHFLYERARLEMHRLKLGGLWGMHSWPKWFESLDDHDRIPIVSTPDNFVVVIAGGEGKHSSCIPTIGSTRSVTRPIDELSTTKEDAE